MVFLLSSEKLSYSTQIIAVVGDIAITDYDADQRARMIAMMQKYSLKNEAAMKNIRSEVQGILIDEQIKKSFVEKSKIEVQNEMVEQFIMEYGKRVNKHTMREIKMMVKSYGIDWDFFWGKVVDEIAWSQLVYWGLSSSIKFTESEMYQRALVQGLDPEDPMALEKVKREMMEERLALDVQKMISKMKRFRIVEEIY